MTVRVCVTVDGGFFAWRFRVSEKVFAKERRTGIINCWKLIEDGR